MGELTLKIPLNRESVKSYDFYVTVTDGGDDRKTSKLFILNVLDVNDNEPVFLQQPYWKSIPENTTVGTTILTVSAKDADQGSNGVVTYRFSNDSNSAQTTKFAINNLNGEITLDGSLDYETTTRYLLPVVAQDGGNPRQESKTTVVIDVTDISDNPPKFERSVYLKEIKENVSVGTTILTVVARDDDSGINSPMKYEIYSGNDGTFAIDSSTGVIKVNGTIDAEKTQSYKLYIRASEVPNPSSSATVSVSITVIDMNDNPPLFSQDSYSFILREGLAKPGRIVTDQLIVRDADKNPEFRQHTYHLSGGDSGKFTINPSSGELQINSTLDYETQVNYSFTVVATETGTPEKYSDNATIYLTLINDNDNKPIFANLSYYYTFHEEVPAGKEIAVITATDADVGTFGQVTYELKRGQSSFFTVDRNTGNITAARTLDYEELHSYQFDLFAIDGGGISKEETRVTINVTLKDDHQLPFTKASEVPSASSNATVSVPITVMDKNDSVKVPNSVPTEISKENSSCQENSLLIVVGLLVLTIVVIVVCGLYVFRHLRAKALRQRVQQSDGGRNFIPEETLQMQNMTTNHSGISSNIEQEPISHPRPSENGGLHEPQYTDLDSFSTLLSTNYQSLSPSSQHGAHVNVNETNSLSEIPTPTYEKLQHNNASHIYEKRLDFNNKPASTTE